MSQSCYHSTITIRNTILFILKVLGLAVQMKIMK